jgi:GTP-binding protein Era
MSFLSGFAAIIGPPNVGKSTLLNRILGTKLAIVSPKSQTTRNRIIGIYHGDGFQIVFMDTPGIHKTRSALHESMVESALATPQEVDMVVLVIEIQPSQDPEIPSVLKKLKKLKKTCILVINKIDLFPKESLLPVIDRFRQMHPFDSIIPVSALTGDGVDTLIADLKSRLKPGPQFFPADMRTDRSDEFLISEIIRENIYLHVKQELPYSSAVTVHKLEEKTDRQLLSISARIHVETESQKGILIGQRGRMVRAIGKSARLELERMFGVRVFLDLKVRVEKNWTKDAKALRRLGY